MPPYRQPMPGARAAILVEETLIPDGCLCSWSAHGSQLGKGLVYRLKQPAASCPLHRQVPREWTSQ